MSRYLERAEHGARLIDVNIDLMLDQTSVASELRWGRLLSSLECRSECDADDAYGCVNALTFDTENSNSIRSCIASARENARHVREQVSSEMFEQLNALYFLVRQTNLDDIWNQQPHEFFSSIRQGAHLLYGITDATINHDQEWFFIQLGRHLERVAATARMLRIYLDDEGPGDETGFEARAYLKWVGLLKSCVAYESYLRAYRGGIQPITIAEFLLLDQTFPGSVRYAADRLVGALEAIGNFTGSNRSEPVRRLAGRLRAQLQYAQIEELMSGGFNAFLQDIENQCNAINTTIYRVFISYPIAELTGA
jgi:uncharacterized alpha-E superfamily protein